MQRREAESQLTRAKARIARLEIEVSDLKRQQSSERLGRLAKNLEALAYVAAHGWKYSGCDSIGMRNGKRGDGLAIQQERETTQQIDGMIRELEGWLDWREQEIINISKGLVNA